MHDPFRDALDTFCRDELHGKEQGHCQHHDHIYHSERTNPSSQGKKHASFNIGMYVYIIGVFTFKRGINSMNETEWKQKIYQEVPVLTPWQSENRRQSRGQRWPPMMHPLLETCEI